MAQKRYLTLISFLIIFCLSVSAVAADNLVIVDFYYSESCHSCLTYLPIIDNITAHYMKNYSGKVIIQKKEVGSNSTNRNEMRARGMTFPSVVVNNETRIPKANLTYDELTEVIDGYIANLSIHRTYNQSILYLPWIGRVDLSSFSLPVLTIVLAGLDSFNPCSFFILIFLLNLLLYLQSRRRMLLVGSIFIFFSGLFYLLFMFILFSSLLLTKDYIQIISVVAGIVALLMGIFSIKDFFFFKKGPSLSMPQEKQKETFKKIRKLVKSPSLVAMLGGTIFLAVTVNFYELICTLEFPWVFTNILNTYDFQTFDYYLYLIFYNIVYVIPLIIILLVFTFTLGSKKLSEWQGRKLKLLSGIMIFSFGIFFLVDYKLLENVITPIALLGLSIILTIVISYLWKRYKENPPERLIE
jgi:thiol-disulfide isomerase/thioredoxin